MSAQPRLALRPAPLWENALHDIDITLEHLHGAHYMPKALANPSSGVIAFPASLDAQWLEYATSLPNKTLLKETKRLQSLYFL